MWIYFVGAVLLILVVYALVTFNSFIKLNNMVKEAFSTMDVYLKKRWDLIPNLVETVKGYAKQEQDTLKKVTELRNTVYDQLSKEEKIKTNVELSYDMPKVMAFAEAYPDLEASENFKDLSDKLTKIEDDIANARKYYNGTVRLFNNKVEMFPNNLLAKLFGFHSQLMFEASPKEKETVKVEL